MTEKLIGDAEVKQATTHPKVMDVAIERDLTSESWDNLIVDLTRAGAVGDPATLRERLFEIARGERHGLYAQR